MSPTIFLDIDGVMWCHETRKPLKESGNDRDEYGYLFPEVHVEALRKIVDATGAVIVISSVWRRFKDVQSMWKDRGLPGVYGGMTPHIPDAPRGWEIYTWMQKNRPYDYKNRREFKNYVILDDDSDMLYWQRLNFRHTPNTTGLGHEHVGEAICMLKQEDLTMCSECFSGGSRQLTYSTVSGHAGYRCGGCGHWSHYRDASFKHPRAV